MDSGGMEFFKPTRGKIFLAVSFLLPVYWLLSFWVTECGIGRLALPPLSDPCILTVPIAYFPLHRDAITPIIIALLISYFLSGVLIFLVKKLKKQKKQNNLLI
jgi:hypothetical protein